MSAPFFDRVADAPAPDRVDWIEASDGVRLRAALWAGGDPLVVVFPGRTEVVEKYGHVVSALTRAGFGVAVLDWRGQGLSDRSTGVPLRGDVVRFADYQLDVQAFWAWLDAKGAPQNRVLLAHSMGGCIGLRALINRVPARAVAFSAPMWGLPLSGILRTAVPALTGALRLFGKDTDEIPGARTEFDIWNNPFDTNELTRDRARYEWAQNQVLAHPELRLGAPSMRWLNEALGEIAALEKLPSPDLPCLCGVGTGEKIVSQDAIAARMARWPGGDLMTFEGALHEILIETPDVRDAFMTRAIRLFRSQCDT